MGLLEDAYTVVFTDIVNNGPGLFHGVYDAAHGDEHFMYGICTVMEYIEQRTGADENFSSLFLQNVIASQDRAHSKDSSSKEDEGEQISMTFPDGIAQST